MHVPSRLIAAVAVITATACRLDSGTSPSEALQLLSVSPSAASVGVSVSSPVLLTFSRSMMTGMEARVLLHEGSVTGPVVDGMASWTGDHRVLMFTPTKSLKAHTTYVIHLAAEMRGADGAALDHGACGDRGGLSVTGAMMGQNRGGMMGTSWQAANGTYGMEFTFTTG